MADFHVTLYSGPDNEEMVAARRFLEQRKIQYEEKNVAFDSGARGELLHRTGKSEYPAIHVDGHIVVGFFEKKWEHLLPIGHSGQVESPLQ